MSSRVSELRAPAWRRLFRDPDPEPCTHASFNRAELFGREHSELIHQARCRNRNNALCIECARTQKSRGDNDLKSGLADCGRVRNDSDQRSVGLIERNAKYQARADLCGQTEINQINGAAKRRLYPLASRRSYPWKT